MSPNPWALVSAAEYEGHMGPEGADQLAPLSAILGKVLAALRPARLLLPGIATGNGLEHVDPSVTRRVVGLDLNLSFLAVARQRQLRLGAALELYCTDVGRALLDPQSFDLCFAGLFFEHVDARRTAARLAGWLAPGGALVAVLQLPGPAGAGPSSRFASVCAAAEAMRLLPPEELAGHLSAAGLRPRAAFEVPVAHGRRFHVAHWSRPK